MPDRAHEIATEWTPEQAEMLFFCLHHSMLDLAGDARALPVYALATEGMPPVRGLAEIFRAVGIRSISLEPVQAAKALVRDWLTTGAFDPMQADIVHAHAGEINDRLAPVTRYAISHGILAKDLSNEPDRLTSVRSALLITEMMLGWHEAGRLQDPAWRHAIAAKTALFAELTAEMQEQDAPSVEESCPPPADAHPRHSHRQRRFH